MDGCGSGGDGKVDFFGGGKAAEAEAEAGSGEVFGTLGSERGSPIHDPVFQDGSFIARHTRVFLGFAVVVGLVSAPVQSSSRSLLARLAPRDKITQYFGLFAFSGKVTAFLAPLAVALVTTATQSQRLGMSAIALFLIAGIALMLPVRSPPREA